MELVGPGDSGARGTPVAQGVWDLRVPDGVEVCLVVAKVHVDPVAPAVETVGVQGLVDVADEVEEKAKREVRWGVPVGCRRGIIIWVKRSHVRWLELCGLRGGSYIYRQLANFL